jgi:hypothetical protein
VGLTKIDKAIGGKEDAIEVVEHLNLAISALEKQVAKRPEPPKEDNDE